MLQKKISFIKRINLDGLGITASVLCAIHCALMPLLFTSLPLLGVDIIHNKGFEFGMIGLAFIIGTYALYHGFRRHHHSLVPFLLFTVGFIFLVVKEILPVHRVWMVFPALFFIITAHYINFLSCRKASHCHDDDCDHH